ncbi:hypothetical protein J1N35_018445 [Gossypium stocksii]|uniref:Uncharacterized protein n=1 Tax=Gossypium stocksii TaxID=47602 RepID=A0A9D3VR75_9ROSI|nr:hypothetical protein J1N35_018445 [Gossypium stocksii]
MTIRENIHAVIPTHRGIRVERKKASSLRSFKMTNEKVDISLQVHQSIHPQRNIYEEVNVSRMHQSTHPQGSFTKS